MNKKGIIITIVIVILALLIGFGSCYAIFGTKKCNETKCIEKKCNSEDEEESNKENKNLDSYFSALVPLYQQPYQFISSRDDSAPTDHIGMFYENKISEEAKVLYSLNEIISAHYSELEEKGLLENEFTLKLDTIKTIVNKFFTTSEINSDFKTSGGFDYLIESVECEQENCKIKTYNGGFSAGARPLYVSKVVDINYNNEANETEYIVSAYYIEFVYNETEKNEDDEMKIYAKLYDRKGGNLIETVEDKNDGNDYSSYFKNINTYKFLFDKEGRMVTD